MSTPVNILLPHNSLHVLNIWVWSVRRCRLHCTCSIC